MDAGDVAGIISVAVLLSAFALPAFSLRRARREREAQAAASEWELGDGPGGASVSIISTRGPFASLESLRAAQHDRPASSDPDFGTLGRLLQPTADGFWEILLTPGPDNTITAMWFGITEELYRELCELARNEDGEAGYRDPANLWCSPEVDSLEVLRQSAGLPPLDPKTEMSLFLPMEPIGRLEELEAFQRAWLDEEGDAKTLGWALIHDEDYYAHVILIERPSGAREQVHFSITEELYEMIRGRTERPAN
jgi:hypothetical protein